MIEEQIDVLEEKIFQLDIITSFETRGWALYCCGSSIDNMVDLCSVIESGRVKNRLEYNVRYLPMPLLENDTDSDLVLGAAADLLELGRGPYYVELTEGKDDKGSWVEPVGIFFIESVVLEPPNLNLIIDRRMSRVSTKLYNKDCIEIPLYELYRIRRQLMKSHRS